MIRLIRKLFNRSPSGVVERDHITAEESRRLFLNPFVVDENGEIATKKIEVYEITVKSIKID